MTTYTVAFPKGGTTKTTTAVELIGQLAEAGRQVLAIDLDEQGTLTFWLGFESSTTIYGTAGHVLRGEQTVAEAMTPSPSLEGVQVLVGTDHLSRVDTRVAPDMADRLRQVLAELPEGIDDVVIDVPPAMSGLTVMALAAADVVIAPVACEAQAAHQVARFQDIIAARVARKLRPGAKIDYLVPTRYDGRRVLDRDVVLGLRNAYGDQMRITRPIPEAQVVKDSYVAQLPVGRYDPMSKPALVYAAVMDMIIERSRA